MTNRTGLALFSLLLFLFAAGCRNTDATRPSIEVYSPADNQSYTACDELTITGRATDDRGLSEVTAVLHGIDASVWASTNTSLSGRESEFTLKIKLGNRYSYAGEYTLAVTSFDQAGNSAVESIPMTLAELPRVYERSVWAGEDAGGGAALFYTDSAGSVTAGPFLGNGLSGFVVDNRNRLLLVSELYGGRFTGRLLGEFEQEFEVNLPTGTLQEGITGISAAGKKYYLSLGVPPYLRVFDPLGDQIESWDEVLYPAREVLASSSQAWVAVKGITGSPIKTDNYNKNTRQLISTNVLGWVSDHLLQLPENDVLAAGNENGQGRIRVLDGTNMVARGSLDLNEQLLDVAGEGEDWFVLSSSGLWRFNADNATIFGPLASGSYTALGWEAVGRRIYLGRENVVEVLDENGTLLTTHVGGYGTVGWIDFQYNK